MNKNVKKLVLSLSVLIACSCAAYADGNAFTPLNFEDATQTHQQSEQLQQQLVQSLQIQLPKLLPQLHQKNL